MEGRHYAKGDPYLQQSLSDESGENLTVASWVAGDLSQPTSAFLEHAAYVIFTYFEHLPSREKSNETIITINISSE